jgi:hypothetical protein
VRFCIPGGSGGAERDVCCPWFKEHGLVSNSLLLLLPLLPVDCHATPDVHVLQLQPVAGVELHERCVPADCAG